MLRSARYLFIVLTRSRTNERRNVTSIGFFNKERRIVVDGVFENDPIGRIVVAVPKACKICADFRCLINRSESECGRRVRAVHMRP
jgi:hypothetical protein